MKCQVMLYNELQKAIANKAIRKSEAVSHWETGTKKREPVKFSFDLQVHPQGFEPWTH